MKKLLAVVALGEAATGALLFMSPAIVVGMLFGAEIQAAGIAMSRIAGISLIALGLACWPSNSPSRPLSGMLIYSALAMLYLAYLGIDGKFEGMLLWPAISVHFVLTILLAWAWLRDHK